MSSSEVHELAVAIRPEGVDETVSGLDSVQEGFDQTANSVDDTSGLLDGLTQRIQGSAAAILGGLGVLTAGLLSQVPVVGEAISGLAAVFDALAIRVDQVLRPVLSPLTNLFFDLADAILQLDGVGGQAIGAITTIIGAFGLLEAGIIAVNAALGLGLPSVVATIVGILGGPLTAAILLIVGAVTALAVAWETNFMGIRDTTMSVIESLRGAFDGFVQFLSNAFSRAVATGIDFVAALVLAFGRLEIGLVSATQKLSARLQTGFELLFDLLTNSAKSFANRFVSIIETAVNRAISAVPSMIRTELGLSRVNLGTPFQTRSQSEIVSSARGRLSGRDSSIDSRAANRERELESQVSRIVAALQNATQETTVEVDGREIARSQSRFLGEGASGIGRTRRGR